MKLATHNTMTYLKPKQWWCKLLPFIAKCQGVDYKKQHELGAEGYDLRIFWDKKGELEFRHGLYRYPADNIFDVLDYANENHMIVRILFEIRNYNEKYIKNLDELKERFVEFCEYIEEKYTNIKFYGGNATGSWEQVYKFKGEVDFHEVGKYSSVTSLFVPNKNWLTNLDDWCPWLYAKIMNKQNIEEYKSKDDTWYLSIDFIEMK